MKKFLCMIFAIATAAAMTACKAQVTPADLDQIPWSFSATDFSTVYERATYDIVKKDVLNGDKVVAEGTLTITVENDHKDEETGFYYSRIDMNSSMTYDTENAPEADRGKTDTVTSSAVFQAAALTPYSSEKKVTLEPREGESRNLSYSIVTDYANHVSTITYNDGTENSVDFGGASLVGVYDNEMLYYFVRALKGCSTSGSATFNLANFYDIHARGSFFTYPMRLSCAAGDPMFFPQDENETINGYLSDEQGSVSTISANLAINNSTPGPAIILTYSDTPFVVDKDNGKSTKKVLLRILRTEYSLEENRPQYETTCTLTDYTTDKTNVSEE